MESEADTVHAERVFVLPSTYVFGGQYMGQNMHETIYVPNTLHPPDVFLTMTCSPNWTERSSSLFRGQKRQNKRYIATSVFRIKFLALMVYLIEGQRFGEVLSHIMVIEFRKGDLPHAHCNLSLYSVESFSSAANSCW